MEVYQFSQGTQDWFYTSSDTDITLGANTYVAVPIKRGKIQATQDIPQSTIKINVSRDNGFTAAFIAAVPTEVINITITRFHSAGQESAVIFKGRVLNVAFQENTVAITCQQNLSMLRNPGLRRVYQTTCPHVLYGGYCGVIKASFKITATISAINSSKIFITSPEFSVNISEPYNATWFLGGILELTENGATTRRFITNHNNTSGSVLLSQPLTNAEVGSEVSVYPGCNRATATCAGKFNNIENYGGFPYIPKKNPQDGTPIF
jgi:uncharacterized phage protein (TIGR02218 family)